MGSKEVCGFFSKAGEISCLYIERNDSGDDVGEKDENCRINIPQEGRQG